MPGGTCRGHGTVAFPMIPGSKTRTASTAMLRRRIAAIVAAVFFPSMVHAQSVGLPNVVRVDEAIIGQLPSEVQAGALERLRVKPGDVPIRVQFASILYDTVQLVMTVRGKILHREEGTPLAGLHVFAVCIDTTVSSILSPHAGTLTEENGTFDLSWTLHSCDVLCVTLLGHLEQMIPIGRVRSRLSPDPAVRRSPS